MNLRLSDQLVKSGFGMGSMRVIALSWGKPDYLGVTILGDARLSDALCFIAVGVDTDGGERGGNWPYL